MPRARDERGRAGHREPGRPYHPPIPPLAIPLACGEQDLPKQGNDRCKADDCDTRGRDGHEYGSAGE